MINTGRLFATQIQSFHCNYIIGQSCSEMSFPCFDWSGWFGCCSDINHGILPFMDKPNSRMCTSIHRNISRTAGFLKANVMYLHVMYLTTYLYVKWIDIDGWRPVSDVIHEPRSVTFDVRCSGYAWGPHRHWRTSVCACGKGKVHSALSWSCISHCLPFTENCGTVVVSFRPKPSFLHVLPAVWIIWVSV